MKSDLKEIIKNIDKKDVVKYSIIGVGASIATYIGLGIYSIIKLVKSLDDISK